MSVPSEHNTSIQHSLVETFDGLNEEVILKKESILPKTSEEIDIESFFTMVIAHNISDVHLRVGAPPAMRKDGFMIHTNFPPLSKKGMQLFAAWLIPENLKPLVAKKHDMDFSLTFGQARFRVNMLYGMGQLAFAIRIIPTKIPTIEELGLPKIIERYTEYESGLVLVTGSAGQGKSTTLASLLNHVNRHHAKHIITLEDPVEFVFANEKSVVTQRQLGIDTPSFPEGIKHALRQDPDVLLIGEMRDKETAMTALEAAETGILVFSTLHTSDSIQTINRIIDFFQPHERDHIRLQLANVFKGAMCQKLYHPLRKHGRAAVAEVMMVTATVRDYLIKNEIDTIYSLLEEARFEGMQSLNHALYRLCYDKEISLEEALQISNNPNDLKQKLKGIYHGSFEEEM